jgi:peptidyl-tRNA hydrolase, PTH1 family
VPAPDAPAPGSPCIPRLIVGLGNPGLNYADTRHNVGFLVLDELAQRMNLSFQPEKRWTAHLTRAGSTWFAKPQTYMNESGVATGGIARFHRIDPSEVLAVYDDVDLPLGSVRFKLSGSAAGHNGVKSLITHLGTNGFPRLKLGIATTAGRPDGERMASYVLGTFREEDRPLRDLMIREAADAVMLALQKGLDAAMNATNRKATEPK